MVNFFIKKMQKRKTVVILLSAFLLCGFFGKFSEYSGNWRDKDEMLSFVKSNAAAYFTPPKDIKSKEEQRQFNKFRAQMQRLVLKIDASDIRNEETRKQVVAIRRQALKARDSSSFTISNFDTKRLKNRLGGEFKCLFAGKKAQKSPWADFKNQEFEKIKGQQYLLINFDIKQGEVVLRQTVTKRFPFKEHNVLEFAAKGNVKAIKVCFTDVNSNTISHIIEEISEEWKNFVFPFSELLKESDFDIMSLQTIDLILSDEICGVTSGQLAIDNLKLTSIKEKLTLKKKGKVHVNIEGGTPFNKSTSFLRNVSEE